MRTGIVVVTITLAAAILLSVSLRVAKDARRESAPQAPALDSAATRQGVTFREPSPK